MTNLPETTPGVTPSQGAIRPGRVISASHGANSGLAAQPGASVLVSGLCGRESTLDIWSTEPPRHAASLRLELELADVGTSFDNVPLPADADADRNAWSSHLLPVLDVAASLNVTRIAVTAARCVRLFRVGAGSWDAVSDGSLRGHPGTVSRVAMSSRGDRVASVDQTGAVMIWSSDSRTQIHRLRISKVPHSVAFIWNDLLVAVGDEIGRVVCWELTEGRRHLQFQAHRGPVERIQFSQEAGVLLTVGGDQSARLWNLEQGSQVGRALVHRGGVRDATFASGGRYVATVGGDGSVALWSTSDGSLVDWMGGAAPLCRVAYVSDRAELVVSGTQSIRVVEVDWARIREIDAAGRNAAAPVDRVLAEPPTRVAPTYSGAMGVDVPVGSIMQARQTGDLPFPDRSNLAITRGAGVPTAGSGMINMPTPAFGAVPYSTAALPAVGAPAQAPFVPATTVLPAIGGPIPGFGARPSDPPAPGDVRPRGIPNPGSAAPTQAAPAAPAAAPPGFGAAPSRDYGAPSTDDFFAGIASRAPAPTAAAAPDPAATSLPAAPAPPVAAKPANPAAGHATPPWNSAVPTNGLPPRPTAVMGGFAGSRLPTDQVPHGRGTQMMGAIGARPQRPKSDPAGVRPVGNATAAPPVSVRPPSASPRPTPMASLPIDDIASSAEAHTAERAMRKPIELPPRREFNTAVPLAIFVSVLVGAFVGYFAVFQHYTERAFPGSVAEQAESIEAVFETKEDELNDAFEEFREQRESQLRTYETSGTMLPSDLERVRQQVNRQIEQRQAEVAAEIDRERFARDTALGSLGEAREAAAATSAKIGAAVLGALFGLITAGVVAVRRRQA